MATEGILRAALATLDEQHLAVLQTTVEHILSTQLAERVFAQVAEGVPTKETSKFKPYAGMPEIQSRTQPGPEALDLVRNWRSDFSLSSLEVDSNVIQAYRGGCLGSDEFKLRLLEITAVVIHTLAALLFDHTNQPPYKCPPPKRKVAIIDGWPEKTDEWIPSPYPTYLYHKDYLDHDLYPMGIADVVGYWAETHLFGGVVVFYHGESDQQFLSAYLHPDCKFKVFKLSDAQVDEVVSFGLHGEPTVASPFPIQAEHDAVRLFPEFTMSHYHIYRSKNDRRVQDIDVSRWNMGGRLEDDPHLMEFMQKHNDSQNESSA